MAGRWFSPLLFFVATAYVYHYNSTRTDSVLLLPFLEPLVGPSPQAQGQATWQLTLLLAVVLSLWALWGMRGGGVESDGSEP